MRAASGSTHLRSRSSYSFGLGVDPPAALLDTARSAGFEALALTDRDGLYGAVPFYQAAVGRGVRPILGAEITLAPSPPRDPRTGTRRPRGPAAEPAIVAIAEDRDGYASLCRLVTARHLEERFDAAPVLARSPEGLIVLCPHAERLEALAAALPPRTLYAEVCASRGASERRALLLEALRLDLPLAATWDVIAARPEGVARHAVLRAIDARTTLDRLPRAETEPKAAWLAPPETFERAFRDAPAALEGTREIAERCHLTLEFGAYRFPRVALPPGQTAIEALRAACESALPGLYGARTSAAAARLSEELAVIGALGFADYFLIVHDIVKRAKSRGIPIVGHGSAADSLVSHLLGITEVDPLAHDLYFQRFLNRGRSSPPDIDLDICWRRRDEVIDDVIRAFGPERAAMISMHNEYHLRSAFRDVARAFGLGVEEINALSRRLPHHYEGEIAEALAAMPECRDFPRDEEPYHTILREAAELAGRPRHLGIHPGGLVLSPGPLAAIVPLERAAKGIVVTQYDMGPVEELGLLKMDLLGHRSLSVIADTVTALGPHAPALDRLPPDLPEIAAMLGEARTLGCFQTESPAMRNLLRMMRAETRDDLIAALSMIRPGPSSVGMKEAFVRRRRGEEPVRYLHPALEPILEKTYGILLYQEDVLRVAEAVAGFTLEEADQLREAISKRRSPDRMETLAARFREGARARGAPPEIVSRLWEIVSHFAEYSFCKAHAATYGFIAYRALYLKAHYPAAFFAAVLSNQGGFYGPGDYLEEARRCGVEIRLPDVNASEIEFTACGHALRIGLLQVKGLAAASMRAIVESRRRDGPYRSLAEFLCRVPLSRPEAEALVRCGALDSLRRTRPELLVELATLSPALRRRRPPTGLFATAFPEAPRRLPPGPKRRSSGTRGARGLGRRLARDDAARPHAAQRAHAIHDARGRNGGLRGDPLPRCLPARRRAPRR